MEGVGGALGFGQKRDLKGFRELAAKKEPAPAKKKEKEKNEKEEVDDASPSKRAHEAFKNRSRIFGNEKQDIKILQPTKQEPKDNEPPKQKENDFEVISQTTQKEELGFRRMRTGIFRTEDALLNNMSSTGFKRQPTKRTKAVLSTNRLKLTKDKNDGGKKKVNQYILEKKLGEGSFAAVYLCTDSKTKTKYAIK